MRPAQAREGAEQKAPSATQGSTRRADQPINAGVRREVPTDDEGRSHTQWKKLWE